MAAHRDRLARQLKALVGEQADLDRGRALAIALDMPGPS